MLLNQLYWLLFGFEKLLKFLGLLISCYKFIHLCRTPVTDLKNIVAKLMMHQLQEKVKHNKKKKYKKK